jgi:hypothetical protein
MTIMKQRLATLFAAGTLFLFTVSAASADRGAPGSTFPEQPDDRVLKACATLLANPGQDQNAAPNAIAITTGVVVDACFGG